MKFYVHPSSQATRGVTCATPFCRFRNFDETDELHQVQYWCEGHQCSMLPGSAPLEAARARESERVSNTKKLLQLFQFQFQSTSRISSNSVGTSAGGDWFLVLYRLLRNACYILCAFIHRQKRNGTYTEMPVRVEGRIPASSTKRSAFALVCPPKGGW